MMAVLHMCDVCWEKEPRLRTLSRYLIWEDHGGKILGMACRNLSHWEEILSRSLDILGTETVLVEVIDDRPA